MQEEKPNLKEVFKKAAEATEGLPELLQKSAFEIAVNQLLGTSSNQANPMSAPSHSSQPINVPDGDFFTALSSAVSLPAEQLKSVYAIDEKEVLHIVTPLPSSKNIAEQQRLLATLLLLGNQLGQKNEWTSGFDLSRVMREHSVLNKHLSKNMAASKSKTLRVMGVKRARKYGLTPTGVDVAKKQLIELLGEQ